jgi:hypothetical protein
VTRTAEQEALGNQTIFDRRVEADEDAGPNPNPNNA